MSCRAKGLGSSTLVLVLASACLTGSVWGSVRRSLVEPLGLVSGCSVGVAALRRTRRAEGTDASVRALMSLSG